LPRLVGWATLAVLSASPAPTALLSQTIALTGGTVYPVSGPRIEHGTVLIRDGRITAVGTDIVVPQGAVTVDATGRWVTPGLIHGFTDLGLTGVGSINLTREGTKAGDIDAAFNVAEGIDPAVFTIPVTRVQGVTSVVSAPSGGLISGQAVLMNLMGDRLEDLVAKSPVAMVIDLSSSSKDAGGGSRAGVLQRLRLVFRDAAEYQQRTADYRKAQMQALAAPAADLAALGPVLRGELPVIAIANRRSDIESALRLASEFRLRLIIGGGVEAWQMAPELARANIPVALEANTDVPSFDGLAPRLDNAARLRAGGVTVILLESDNSNYRNLRFAAGNAVRNGLKWDDALRAITLNPAEAIGVGDRYGSLEAGKVANVVVWSGDPFEFSSRAEKIYIKGVEIPLTSRQSELLERYRKLPPTY
jgi:imidazolonepropionase-like amidohydrolase